MKNEYYKNSVKKLYNTVVLLIILMMVFSLPVYSFAQEKGGKIEGYVTDLYNSPVSNVNVMIENTRTGSITNTYGYFYLKNIKPGKYILRFSHVGYKTEIKDIIILTKDSVTNIDTIKIDLRINEHETIFVSATRSEKNVVDVSRPLNIVSGDMVRERNSKTSSEALREETGIFVQKTNHGGGSAIIRGLSSNRLLLMVDGIRLNNSTYRLGNHQYLTTIDNNIISRIEVVRGPTSVLYGSDALGGAINVITNRPDLLNTKDRVKAEARIFGRYSSADEEKTTRTDMSVVNNKLAFNAGFSYKDFGDLKRGGNSGNPLLENSTQGEKQSPSGFKEFNFDSKLFYEVTADQNITAAFQKTGQKDVPRYDKYENNNYTKWLYEPQKRTLAYINYEKNLHKSFFSSLKLALSYHLQQEGRITQKNEESDIIREKDDVNTYGFLFQLNSSYKTHYMTMGTDIYFDRIGSSRSVFDCSEKHLYNDVRGRYIDGSDYNSFGVFLQDEVTIKKKWILTAGVRHSYFTAKYKLPIDNKQVMEFSSFNQDYQKSTANIGLVYKLNEKIFLNSNLSQGFRAPNLSDLSKFGESKGSVYEVPNVTLEPEKVLSFDIGLKTDMKKFKGYYSLYYSRIGDIIESADALYNGMPVMIRNGETYKVKSKQNTGDAAVTGFEGAVEYYIYDSISIHGNFTYTYGTNRTLEEPVGGIPPAFGLSGIKWKTGNSFADFFIRFASKQDRLSSDDLDDPRIPAGGTPGWKIFNIRYGRTISDHLLMQISLENIFDRNYREHGSGINGPGRNFILSFNLSS